jgi:iron complex transport system substrate-binding protein
MRFVADFKNAKRSAWAEFTKNKKDPFVFWFSSSSPSSDAYVGGKNSASGLSPTYCGHNAITSET